MEKKPIVVSLNKPKLAETKPLEAPSFEEELSKPVKPAINPKVKKPTVKHAKKAEKTEVTKKTRVVNEEEVKNDASKGCEGQGTTEGST